MLIEWLTDARRDAWADLFRRADCACLCRYWHFAGDKNAWLDRVANRPEENVAESAREDHALVAVDGDRVVGHMKVAPRLAKLVQLGPYRAHDLGPEAGVFSVGCVLVDPARRREGIPAALLAGAIVRAKERGARFLEAYPRSAPDLRSAEAWMGREDMYRAQGFLQVAGEHPYPVLRRAL